MLPMLLNTYQDQAMEFLEAPPFFVGWGTLALVGVCMCLALGTLQSALALGFPVLVAHVVAARRAGASRWWALGGKHALRLVVPVAALAVEHALPAVR